MIRISEYSKNFENAYLEAVLSIVDNDTKDFICNYARKTFTKRFKNISNNDNIFKKLILLKSSDIEIEYHNLKQKKINMDKKDFERYVLYYDKLRNKNISEYGKTNTALVKQNGFNVCPYCNRNYINTRWDLYEKKVSSGAQLDHFYPKAIYPIFALSLYNLIPVCSTCNLIKSESEYSISPFNMSNDDITFSYNLIPNDDIDIIINSKSETLKKQIEDLKIKSAYEIHKNDVKKLIEKKKIYTDKYVKEIIDNMQGEISKETIKELIFGKELNYEDFGKYSLSKLNHDILRHLKIYE